MTKSLSNKSARAFRAILSVLASASVWLNAQSASAETLFKFEFNEGTGTTVTDTASVFTGSFGAVVDPASYPTANPDSPAAPAADQSLTIHDPSGYLVLDVAGLPAFNDFTKPITAEAWIWIPSTAAARNEAIVGYGASWKLGLRADGRVAFTLFGVVDATVDIFPPIETWFHLAAVWEPGVGITYYLDGVNTAFFAETRPMRAAAGSILGLGSAGTTEPINATLDRVRVHQAALTAEELDSIAATPKAPLASTLASFTFNETAAPYLSGGLADDRAAVFAQDYLIGLNSPTWSSLSPSKGAADKSISFDGNDRIRVPDPNTTVMLSTGDFTVQTWVNYTTIPGTRAVLFSNNGPGGAITFSVTADRRLFITTLGIADTQSAAFIPNDGLWHHIAVVHRNGIDLKFYVDGILRDTIAYTRGVLMTRTELFFTIGSESAGANPYRGLLDRLQFSNEALSGSALDYLPVPGVVPPIPELEIGFAVAIAWPTDVNGYTLQSTTDLNEPRIWTAVGTAASVFSDKFNVLLPIPAQKTFYRLVRPASE